jgi:uncharacterized protein DUF2760
MSRITLAFRCFFRLLFKGSLPAQAAGYLPAEATPAPQLPAAPPVEAAPAPKKEKAEFLTTRAETPAAKARVEPGPIGPPVVVVAAPAPAKKPGELAALHRDGALALLALLQREGRLIDFLRESLDGFGDADIGAAARELHRGCKKVLDEHLKLEAMLPGVEDDKVTVPRGFDPAEIRLIGEVKGEPPFQGVLRHHGWRAADIKLPTLSDGVDRTVLAPAEVEIG